MKKLVIFLSDIHSGSKAALMNPDTVLYEEDAYGDLSPYTPELTESQKYLWKVYEWCIDALKTKIAKNKYDKVVLVLNGDITHGNKHKSLLVSDRDADQILIARANIEPMLGIGVNVLRIVKGTGAHNFSFGSAETQLYDQYKKEYPNIDVGMTNHGRMNVDGFIIDYAHHGPGAGARSWLRGNVIRNYVRDIIVNAKLSDRRVPNMVVRSHIHSFNEEIVKMGNCVCYAYTTPSMSMMDDFAVQVTQSSPCIDNGLLAFDIVDGTLGSVNRIIKSKNICFEEDL